MNLENNEEYRKIYESLDKIENKNVRKMQASKLLYKTHPDLKPEKRKWKKPKENLDSISYL